MNSGAAIRASATVLVVRPNLVTVCLGDGPVKRNEVGYLISAGTRLKAEVLRIRGRLADLQVFEDTRGVRVGDAVELTGEQLSVTLGPGLLGQVYDGLQNPLESLAQANGVFLPRGQAQAPLPAREWDFVPTLREGATVWPGDVLGQVHEGHIRHDITVPFDERESARLAWIEGGRCTLQTDIAELLRPDGTRRRVQLWQRWPVRVPLPQRLLQLQRVQREYPDQPLLTGLRLVDAFFPVAKGGTACIPGPFGAGKTVLQNLIARHADVDVVIIVACGERAGEVVETLTEFPQLSDPRTGRTLMERTTIVCNTSAMPVAARESSIHTGITLGEYYRHMGHDVLVIADSTSRWAQALRETSGRMEEIPGEEAYPAYLDSSIRALYERGGCIRRGDGVRGSLTLIGTVSPAGGNLEEPVTQSTLSVVKTFLCLTAERAYRRSYPAVDPLRSWSRYHAQLRDWQVAHLGEAWPEAVARLTAHLREASRVAQMVQVTGEEGITIEDFVLWQGAELIDSVFLQQDAFDAVDAATPLPRQQVLLLLLDSILRQPRAFDSREHAAQWFTQLTAMLRNLNYASMDSPAYGKGLAQVHAHVAPA